MRAGFIYLIEMPSLRVTQKDIARHLGMTQATVSLALGEHPRISEETRELVRKAAKELGYVSDPYLSGLSVYRKSLREASFKGTLAWLSNYPEGSTWRKARVFNSYFDGAARRASELGYSLEEQRLRADGMTPTRMESILLARNVHGLLVAPQPKVNLEIDFSFQKFSAITFGYTLKQPQLHLAALNQYHSMETTFQKLLDLGYRRPGLAMADDSDLRTGHRWSAAFRSEQCLLPARRRVPLLLSKNFDRESFVTWFTKYRPDVVVALWPQVLDWLLEMGEKVPETTGFALFSVPDPEGSISGVWANPELIGEKAVEFLIDMIHRNECGVPDVPLCILVDGTWIAGDTLRSGSK